MEVVDADPVPEVPLLHLLPVLVVVFDPYKVPGEKLL